MTQDTQLTRLGLFDANAPRYTSYPTAPHFSDRVTSRDVSRWIEAIPEGARISLYVHIPFCRNLCWFCACRTQGTRTGAPIEGYLDTLERELRSLATLLPPGVTLGRLHWGGGTPTMLSPSQISRLATLIDKVAPLAPGAEFSVEIDPKEIGPDRAAALAEAGLTRASLGVQDFDHDIQQTIGRIQSFEITRRAVDLMRDAGVDSVNADILYGLPHQTPERIAASVQKLLSLNPDRVALYGYAHVPWMAKRQQLIPTDALPTPEERLRLFETARDLFLWDGYEAIGIDHFARPDDGLAQAARNGTLRRNFQGYTDDQSAVLIGVGASSISRFPQGYAQNAPATSDYARRIGSGLLATAKGHAFQGDDLLRGRIIEAIMCDFAVDAAQIAQECARPVAEIMTMLKAATEDIRDVAEITPSGLRIPPRGQPAARLIAQRFDAYAGRGGKHSAAI